MNKSTVAQKVEASNLSSSAQRVLQRKCVCGNQTVGGGECAECGKKKRGLQRKLTVGASNDPLEREADRVAEQVMGIPTHSSIGRVPPRIQRLAGQSTGQEDPAPVSVDRVLASSGRPLEPVLREDMEERFGHDFSQVRVHSGALAEKSTREVNARAYTVGHDIIFGSGEFSAQKQEGRHLIAHELTHVVQQSNNSGKGNTLRRADQDAVDRTISLGSVVGSGIQFFPTNVVDTVVGPVSVRGGLLNSRASRLNVIVAENLTPRLLARQILPLWITATPFAAPGAATPIPLDIIDEETLAKGLLVYNQYYLPVPAMRRWRAGLNFPLPVEIDEATGIATLHPTIILNLASAFDAAWTPLLDSRVQATAVAAPADLARDVTAFLTSEPTAMARGIHLDARAQTNASAELPFIREVFSQLGTNGFEVALNFIDHLVNREVSLLAAQTDGAAILAIIGTALAPPAAITPEQQRRLDRANLMLGLVAGVSAQAVPSAMTTPINVNQRIEYRPTRILSPCACITFIHNNETNARNAAEELHNNCPYNLAIVGAGQSRGVPIRGSNRRIDPNELFPSEIQNECTNNEASCIAYEASHNDLRAMHIQFFLTIKRCSENFRLPTVALHNNALNDTASFRRRTRTSGRQGLRGDFFRESSESVTSRSELRRRLGRRHRGIMSRSRTTNILRWCNLSEISQCHIGDPDRPDHVIWVTNVEDFNVLMSENVNVVLQEGLDTTSGSESETDLSTLFVRLGESARYINIETPISPRNAAMRSSNLRYIKSVLGDLGLDCCPSPPVGDQLSPNTEQLS